jgi:hypothetical protein
VKLVLKTACPLDSVAVPKVAVPSLNVTVPVGLVPVTVAVRATTWLTYAGLGEAAKLVVVVPAKATVDSMQKAAQANSKRLRQTEVPLRLVRFGAASNMVLILKCSKGSVMDWTGAFIERLQ